MPFHAFQFFNVGSLGVTPSDFFIFVFIIYTLLIFIFTKKYVSIPNHSLPKIIIFFTLASLLSILQPIHSGESKQIIQFFKTFAHLLYLIIFGFLAFVLPKDEKNIYQILKVILLLSIIINIYSFYQLAARAFDLPFAWLDLNNVGFGERGSGEQADFQGLALQYKNFYRATSFFSEPSALASWNLLNLSIIIPLITNKRNQIFKNRSYLIFSFVFSILTMLITFSLTAFVGLFLLFLFSFYVASRKNKIFIFKLFGIGIIITVIIDLLLAEFLEISVINLIFERIFKILSSIMTGKIVLVTGDSFFSRWDKIVIGFDTYLSYPITGVGIGLFQFNNAFGEHFTDNSISQVMSEIGFLGGLSFTLIFTSAFYACLYLLKKAKKTKKLSENDTALIQIAAFIIIYEFFINFGPGNIFVALGMWLPLFLVIRIIFNSFDKLDHQKLNIKITQKTFVSKFIERINQY